MEISRSWFWLLLVIPLAIGFARLRFDTEIMNLLPEKLPVAEGLELYQQNFSDAREWIVTIEAPKAEDAEAVERLLTQSLRARTNLVAAVVWRPPWLENPAKPWNRSPRTGSIN